MKLFVLLVLYPALINGSPVPCDIDLTNQDNTRKFCIFNLVGGEQNSSDLQTAHDKAVEKMDNEELVDINEVFCCVTHNVYICKGEWYKRCHGGNIKMVDEYVLPDNYKCKKKEYTVGKCERSKHPPVDKSGGADGKNKKSKHPPDNKSAGADVKREKSKHPPVDKCGGTDGKCVNEKPDYLLDICGVAEMTPSLMLLFSAVGLAILYPV